MEHFCGNSYRLIVISFFLKKPPSQMFDWILNRSLPLENFKFNSYQITITSLHKFKFQTKQKIMILSKQLQQNCSRTEHKLPKVTGIPRKGHGDPRDPGTGSYLSTIPFLLNKLVYSKYCSDLTQKQEVNDSMTMIQVSV